MNYAYLRVSTSKQTLENQKNEIENYVSARNIVIDKWIYEVVSGKKSCQARRLGALIRRMKEGDTLYITEISRLSRTLTDIMGIVGALLKKNVSLYSIKEGYAFDDSINSKVLVFAFGLVAEIERNLISMRTKEALELRRKSGIPLGRPSGTDVKMKVLVDNASDIHALILAGIPLTKVCRRYGVSVSTFYRFRKTYESRQA